MVNVLLLREPSSDTPDRYESAFTRAGYHPTSISVLTTLHDNVERLLEIVRDGPKTHGFGGVVITSKRSCDTWREALKILRYSDSNHSPRGEGENEGAFGRGVADWATVPFYVVGQATATALKDLFTEYNDLGLGSPPDVRGQSSGSAAILGPFILSDVENRPLGRLLYLTGDKNKDTISRLLEEGGVELEPLQVYRTQGSPVFEKDLEVVLASRSSEAARQEESKSKHWWIIYFAPSAAAYVTPILRKHFYFESTETETEIQPTPSNLNSNTTHQQEQHLIQTKIAAIGPTTRDFLHDELGLRVHVMAQKPTPEDVVSVVTNCDRRDGYGEK